MYGILRNYFGSVFTNESNLGDLPQLSQLFDGQTLYKMVIDSEIVKSKLRQLKPDKAPGIDGIPTHLLVKTSGLIWYPIGVRFMRNH